MAVNWPINLPWFPVDGVELAAIPAGIRYRNRDDLVLVRLAEGTAVAGVFTRNAFCAAPVHLARAHLADGSVRALLINAGNANAGTGAAGYAAALESCELAAEVLGIAPNQVLPFSTGVIGQQMPLTPFKQALPDLAAALAADGWERVSRAIMTTDTLPKLRSRQVNLTDGRCITLTGIAKGAGMIKPDMATMLAFLATDAPVEPATLQSLLNQAVQTSFNAITVDGDTSTNDACMLMATGRVGGSPVQLESADGQLLLEALQELMQELAQGIIRDAEGATRFIAVQVEGASTVAEARQVAYAVAESPLVKTAAFAGDPNWGRILAAVGRSGVSNLAIDAVSLWLDEVALVANGQPHPEYHEAAGAAVTARPEYTIRIDLGRGAQGSTVWTCDYSYDYVKINAEYRS